MKVNQFVGVYIVVHVLTNGQHLGHLGSGCRIGNKEEAVHYVTDDPLGQLNHIVEEIEFGIKNQCPDIRHRHREIEYSYFEEVPINQRTFDDKLTLERRFGVAA